METSKKNTPGPLVVGLISTIILLIIFYLILLVFFPELLQQMTVGKEVPVK